MDCNTCKEKQKHAEPVSYLAFESMKATLERTIRRLWILIIILVILLFGTNAAWIYYESQWEVLETTEVSQDVDTQNGTAYVAGIGDVYYGEGETNSTKNQIPKA